MPTPRREGTAVDEANRRRVGIGVQRKSSGSEGSHCLHSAGDSVLLCACVRVSCRALIVLDRCPRRRPFSRRRPPLPRLSLSMYSRPHTQVAPPQQANDVDLPLFDLSALGGAMEAAVEEETLVEQPQEGDADDAAAQPAATVVKANGHASVGSAFASLAALAASSPALSSSAAAQAAAAAQASADAAAAAAAAADAAALAAAAEDEDLYGTRIRASSLCACVLGSSTSSSSIAQSAASLMDRAGFELDLLQNLSASPEALAAVFVEATTVPEMVKKNRYSNVIPTRKGRVVLPTSSNNPADSYINACLLPPLLPGCAQPYIAAQAPLPHTAQDFWHMAWTQGTGLVVMLTKERERDSRGNIIHKAHPYWPEAPRPTAANAAAGSSSSSSAAAAAAANANANGADDDDLPSAQYGPYTVTLLSTHTEPDLLIRELLVSRAPAEGAAVAEEPRQVHQVQYTGWPDFGVPDDSNEATGFMRIFTLYRTIRTHLHKQHATNIAAATAAAAEKEGAPVPSAPAAPTPSASSASNSFAALSSSPSSPLSSLPAPVVVHCSAGIGRSGVWIAIDALLDCLAWHTSRGTLDQASVDLFALVRRMRESRHGMLQTKEQYAYVLHFVATCMRKQMFGVYDSAAAVNNNNSNGKAAAPKNK